jgi:valyl-tRNA synthetase
MLELLTVEEELVKQDNITHTVKCAERSGTPIEIIPTYQWFVKVVDKKDALKAKGDQCNWYPEFMHIRLNQWIDGLKEDWCVSRQRFFGVPFPVWYSKRAGEEGKIISAETLPVDPLVDLPKGYSREEVEGSADVMDTWATSSVSPQINAHGISKDLCADKDRFGKLFPANLRPQAHEIIRTWAFYTIVKAHLHSNDIPWKNLMISGWCLAADKSKMSKSKGNVITPVDLILEKGADVVRYWASTSRLGADTAFSEDLLKIGRKLVTKLWNATAFAAIHLMKIEAKPMSAAADVSEERITETLDKWILSRLHKAVVKATLEFGRFEYCDARVAVEEFFWKDFCDNYLELVKARAYGEIGDAKSHASAHLTLYHCLNTILRLFAPFIPHVTEELFSHLFDDQGSLHGRGMWPKSENYPAMDAGIEASGICCVGILEAVRKAKSERNVSIKFPIKELTLARGSADADYGTVAPIEADLKSAGNIQSIVWSQMPQEKETDDKRFSYSVTFGEPPAEAA